MTEESTGRSYTRNLSRHDERSEKKTILKTKIRAFLRYEVGGGQAKGITTTNTYTVILVLRFSTCWARVIEGYNNLVTNSTETKK